MPLALRFTLILLLFGLLSSVSLYALPGPWPKQAASGLYGYTDTKGRFVIAPRFQHATDFLDGVARVKENEYWGLINPKGEFVLQPRYADIQTFKEQTAIVCVQADHKSRYGLVDVTGKELIPPVYESLSPDYHNQVFIASQTIPKPGTASNLCFGLLSRQHTWLIPCHFSQIRHVRYRTFAAYQPELGWQLYSAEGKSLFGKSHFEVQEFDETMAIVKSSQGWGLVLPDGSWAVQALYAGIYRRGYTRFELQSYAQDLITNLKGKLLFSAPGYSLQPLSPSYLSQYLNGKKILTDLQGHLIPKLAFDELLEVKNDRLLFREDSMVGVASLKGHLILPALFSRVELDTLSGYLKAFRNGLWEVYNQWGKVLTPQAAREVHFQPYGMMNVHTQQEWMLLDASGKQVGRHTFQQMQDFEELHAIVSLAGKAAVIDSRGKLLVEPVYDSIRNVNSHLVIGYTQCQAVLVNLFSRKIRIPIEDIKPLLPGKVFVITVNGKKGLVNYKGQEILPAQYDFISPFLKDSLMAVAQKEKWGLLRLNGQWILKPYPGYQDMQPMQEGRAAVRIRGRYGFIDKEGLIRISARYEALAPFSEGLAPFQLKGRWGFLSLNEAIAIQPHYDKVLPFQKGLAAVLRNGYWGLIGRQGKELLKPQFDSLIRLPSGQYLSYLKGQVGLISAAARELLPPSYDTFIPLEHGDFLVSKKGRYGIVSAQGTEVIPTTYLRIIPLQGRYLLTRGPSTDFFTLH
jgi:hypothetical protein